MKNKKGEVDTMTLIVGAFVLIFIAIVFIGIVGKMRNPQVNLLSVSDEQANLQTLGCYTSNGQVNESNPVCNITVSNWYSSEDWQLSKSQCYLKNVIVSNDTNTALTLNTDYKVYSNIGVIQMLNTTDTENSSSTLSNNIVETDYSYCDSGYLTSSADRSLANLWTTFMILAVMGILIGLVFKIWKGK